jgi:hypothetical protein
MIRSNSTTTKTLHFILLTLFLVAIIINPIAATTRCPTDTCPYKNDTHYGYNIIKEINENKYQPVTVYDDTFYYMTKPTLTHIFEYISIQKPILATSAHNTDNAIYLNLAGHGWTDNKEPITVTTPITDSTTTSTPSELTPNETAKQLINDITTNKHQLPDNLLIATTSNKNEPTYGVYIDIAKLKTLYPEIITRNFKWISTGTHTPYDDYTWQNTIWGPT